MCIAIAMFFVAISMFPFATYIRCISAGVPAGPITLIAMGLRHVPTDLIVDTYIKGHKGGLDLLIDRIEAHYLSGGNVMRVIEALISAARAQIPLTFERACAIDLTGRDVLDAVRMRVEPRVISTGECSGIAKNGIEVIVIAKITVRANLDTMVGGAGEETILARVGEGIVAAIGAADTHVHIQTQPNLITQQIMKSGLDSRTAFEILSVDIADVDPGRNVGAMLQTDQAIADKKVGQAKAEGRRALALALNQENKALEQEMRAHLVEAEMAVPIALANSFRAGKLIVQRKKKIQTPLLPPALGLGADRG
ncbi:MAG: flotillin-like FloA family protein [Candidatus Riflebacteria bacterium]|nr:flotillin-like FloA family protein [Candidatus Riflebacteria bacterium]